MPVTKPEWADRLDNVRMDKAQNGWVVNYAWIGKEKAGEPARYENQQMVFSDTASATAFVEALTE
jgi:hypothetical protein